ncbi:MAG TPA: FkbM family methyltransferase [Bacteroidales bacterium]|nr:FkbM family methyltransferase [Bacteroidales bacterium]
MSYLNSFDVKIAEYLKYKIEKYINRRTQIKTLPNEDDIWKSLFQTSDNFEHILEDDVRIILFRDSILCRLIYFGFEQIEISFVKKFLRSGDVFIDIGSNVGLYSLNASKIIGAEGKIYAIEPTPITFNRLLQNINLNKFENIVPLNIGLSKSKTFMDFNISDDGHDAWNSFASLPEQFSSKKINVEVNTLDSLISENNIKNISLIKLDVEGWEKFVLEGSSNLLKQDNSPTFIVEFTETNAFSAGYYLGEIFDLMNHYGYEWYSYNHESNVLQKEIKKLHYPYENLIATKNYELCISRLKREDIFTH